MTRRLNATALAERRYEVAKMNREGMTLAEIGEKLSAAVGRLAIVAAGIRPGMGYLESRRPVGEWSHGTGRPSR